jgi:hypothetical protein
MSKIGHANILYLLAFILLSHYGRPDSIGAKIEVAAKPKVSFPRKREPSTSLKFVKIYHRGSETQRKKEHIARIPPSLLRSFGGLWCSPAEALAKAGRAQPFFSLPLWWKIILHGNTDFR